MAQSGNMEVTNFVHDDMTNPHSTCGTSNRVVNDPGFIQGSSAVAQEQQAVPELLHLFVVIHEVVVVERMYGVDAQR